VSGFPERVYVPNSGGNSVDVIDPRTFKIIDHFAVGRQPQHVIPSYDFKSLWVLNDLGDSVTRIDPRDRPQAGHDQRQRPLQHVQHAGRPVRHRGRGGDAPAGFPRSPDDEHD